MPIADVLPRGQRTRATCIQVPLVPHTYAYSDAGVLLHQISPPVEEAQSILHAYREELRERFEEVCGEYDTFQIPSGELFVEIVCGGYFNGSLPVRCYEPLTAVQLFIDAMERYFVSKPEGRVLHWRTRPEWMQIIVKESGELGCEPHANYTRDVYSIYARLVLV